jgi:hypothetical protein
MPPLPAEAFCVGLGVTYIPPADVDRLWARGVYATLRWLLGRQGVDGPAAPPLRLPVRRPDGSVPTAQELYEQALAATQGWVPAPEQRRDLRLRFEVDVARAHRLDTQIRRVQQELAAGR